MGRLREGEKDKRNVEVMRRREMKGKEKRAKWNGQRKGRKKRYETGGEETKDNEGKI